MSYTRQQIQRSWIHIYSFASFVFCIQSLVLANITNRKEEEIKEKIDFPFELGAYIYSAEIGSQRFIYYIYSPIVGQNN